MTTKTASEAYAALEATLENSDVGDVSSSSVIEAAEEYAAAVRAEALAPRVQSPELAEAEARLRSAYPEGEVGLEDAGAIANELDRLRAIEKRLEAELSEEKRMTAMAMEHTEQVGETAAKQREEYESRVQAVEAENAELRKLCGRAEKVATVCSRSANALRLGAANGALKEEHIRGFMEGVAECLEDPEAVELDDVEAAAKGYGKPAPEASSTLFTMSCSAEDAAGHLTEGEEVYEVTTTARRVGK